MANKDREDALIADTGSSATSQVRRREIIHQLVLTLAALAEGMERRNDPPQASVGHLIAILQTMSDSIVSADDATFSAIMHEAGLLIRAVQERQAYFSTFTVH